MNKTVSVNLGGWFFHIEEDAYQKLHQYLGALNRHFAGEEGAKEIVEDIEGRIAEMFQETLNKHKRQVILPADVDNMIAVMGHPDEFDGGVAQENPKGNSGNTDDTKQPPQSGNTAGANPQSDEKYRRLYRNPDEKVLGGVCSGISAYFGIKDPIWVRLAFLAAFFLFGWGVLLYIILWGIVPEASTAAQKLAMKGEPINVSNLEKTIREGLEGLKAQVEDFSKSENGKKTRFFFEQATTEAQKALPKVLWIAFKVMKVAVAVVGLILLFSLVVSLLGLIVGLFATFKFLLTFIFTNPIPVVLGIASLILLIGIPIVALTYWFIRKIFKMNTDNDKWGTGAAVIWTVSLFAFIALSGRTYSNEFSQRASLQQVIPITQPTGNTLVIDDLPDTHLQNVRNNNQNHAQMMLPFGNWGKTVFDFQNNALFFEDVKLDVEASNDDRFHLVKTLSAISGNPKSAENLAQHIEYVFEQDDSTLFFNPFFSAPAGDKWRNQQVKLTLKVPKGKSVFFANGAEKVIYDVKNTTNTYDGDMIGKRWVMLPDGLTLADAPAPDDNQNPDNQDLGMEPLAPIEPIDPAEPVTPIAPDQSENTTTETTAGKATKKYDFTDFERIEISGMAKVTVKQGKQYAVTTIGKTDALDKLNIDKNGETLEINTHATRWWKWFNPSGNEERIEVLITLPNLTHIEVNGSCQANISGFTKADDFTIVISGVSEAVAEVNANNLNADISGASQLSLNGKANAAQVEVSGASGLKAYNFVCKEMTADVSGASQAEVHVTDKLTAEAAGASTVYYKGNTKNVQSESAGASSVKAKE